jgi:fatty acid desaturase
MELLGLRNQADRRTLAAVGLYFAATALLWGCLSAGANRVEGEGSQQLIQLTRPPSWRTWSMEWAPVAALWASVCWLSLTGAIVTHNLAHVPVFRSALTNQLFQMLVTLTYGHPVSSFVPGHNLSHHRFTQTRRDYMRTAKVSYRWNLANLLLFMPTVAGSVMRSDLAYVAWSWRSRRPFFFRFLSEMILLQAANAYLLWLSPLRAVLCWFAPHLFAQYGIVAISFLQHDGCAEPGLGEESEMNGARNFTGGLLNFLLFNNGFHTIHHKKPHLHWSLLPAAHAAEIEPHVHPGLIEPNFLLYFLRAFVWPGRRVDFRGREMGYNFSAGEDEAWMQPK